MPGPFTHLMICEKGMYQDDILGDDLAQFLSGNYRFVFLGAESPDLPYLSIGVGGNQWADAMHYTRTNSQVLSGFEALRQIWGVRTPAVEVKCAWLLGYVSHMVADATIHPIVNAIVGTPYEEHKEAHRLCEMTMDSLIFEEINHSNLTYAEFSQALEFCKESPYFPELMDFWETQLRLNYPGMVHDPHPSFWFSTYTEALDAAEGGKAAIFRHIGLGGNYFYRNPEEIRTDTSDDYQKYYAAVKFPGGSGPFLTNGFDRAVTNVVNVWKTLYEGLSRPGLSVSQVVRNWDLDSGGDQDDGGIRTYWV